MPVLWRKRARYHNRIYRWDSLTEYLLKYTSCYQIDYANIQDFLFLGQTILHAPHRCNHAHKRISIDKHDTITQAYDIRCLWQGLFNSFEVYTFRPNTFTSLAWDLLICIWINACELYFSLHDYILWQKMRMNNYHKGYVALLWRHFMI